jgi:hypothetical protein
MPITPWSDRILIAELSDEPLFSEDMESLSQRLGPAAAGRGPGPAALGHRPGASGSGPRGLSRAPGHAEADSGASSGDGSGEGGAPDLILNMKSVTFLNSSNIAQLLRLRKQLLAAQRRLRICAVADPVWSVLLLTGLDKVFDFTSDVSTALASLQMGDDRASR